MRSSGKLADLGRTRTTDHPHPAVIHDESIDALPTIECDYAEIKMAGDTTPIRVPLVYESSTGYFGGTDVDRKKVVVGGFVCKMDG